MKHVEVEQAPGACKASCDGDWHYLFVLIFYDFEYFKLFKKF